MPVEIERKFLVLNDEWRAGNPKGIRFCQGYLVESERSPKVRVRRAGERACVTIKGPRNGIVRPEFEYLIPVKDAEELLRLCRKPLIEKTRFSVRYADHVWSVDVFGGVHAGWVLAEIELDDPGETFERPNWLGREVTGDRRYSNATLAILPIDAGRERSAA